MSNKQDKKGGKNRKGTSPSIGQPFIGPIHKKGEFPFSSEKQNNKYKTSQKKLKKQAAKVIKSSDGDKFNHLYSLKSKSKIDLSSQQGKNLDVSETQKAFILNEGLNVYSYARSIGYSVKGAAMILALSAKEGSYGDPKTYKIRSNENNFFGDKIPGTHTNQTFSSSEEGIEYGVSFFDRNKPYVNFRKLARENDPDVSALGEAMKDYNPESDGGLGDKYISWLNDKMLPYVVQRAIQTVDDEMAGLQNKIDDFSKNISKDAPYLSNVAPFLLGNQNKIGLQAIDGLKSEMDNLKQIKQELETGQPGNKPISSPFRDMYLNKQSDLHNKVNAPSDSNHTTPFLQRRNPSDNNINSNPWQGMAPTMPPPFDSALAGAPAQQGMQPSQDTYQPLNTGGANLSGMPATNNISSPAVSNIPTTDNVAPPAVSQNGGGDAGISLQIQTVSSHSNTSGNGSGTTQNDIHAQVVAVLTSAVADHKIGTDIH